MGELTKAEMEKISPDIFPNPADHLLYYSMDNWSSDAGDILLINNIGLIVLQQSWTKEMGNKGVIDIGHLMPGTYTIQFTDNNGVRGVRRVVIMR